MIPMSTDTQRTTFDTTPCLILTKPDNPKMNQQENDVVFIADEVTINTNTLLDFLDGRGKILSLHLGWTYEMVMMAGESLEIADTVLNEEAEREKRDNGKCYVCTQ